MLLLMVSWIVVVVSCLVVSCALVVTWLVCNVAYTCGQLGSTELMFVISGLVVNWPCA